MKISGFSFIRNGIKLRYPFIQSIQSILPLCDEFIIAVGNSDDGTREAIETIASSKIKIIDTIWDDSLREGGKILAQQTDIAFNEISGDWGFYLQGDEVVHENDLQKIKDEAIKYLNEKKIDGLLFSWLHFFGNYNYVAKQKSRGIYPYEVRMIKNNKLIKSFRDAQGFRKYSSTPKSQQRKNPELLNVKKIDATIFHYGKVRGPVQELERAKSFHSLWHSDDWLKTNLGAQTEFDYRCKFPLEQFKGLHPAIMNEKIENENWNFIPEKKNIQIPLKYKLLNSIESLTGIRPFEFKNYKLK